jgi:FeS assembly SUF system regulator
MLKLSKMTDYAVVVMVRLSNGPAMQTSPGIALATGIPEPTVAKVLKTLAAAKLVRSIRGAHGGYQLVRALDDVPILDVITSIDGPIAVTACVDGASIPCGSSTLCPMHGRWTPVNDAIARALGAITLAEMMGSAPFLDTAPPMPIPARRAAPALASSALTAE